MILNAIERNREIDGVAGVEKIVRSAHDIRLALKLPHESLARYLVEAMVRVTAVALVRFIG
jgi:hypothetical protein